jgi:hypothetical protein
VFWSSEEQCELEVLNGLCLSPVESQPHPKVRNTLDRVPPVTLSL